MKSFFTKISFAGLGLFTFNAAHASEFFLKINRNGQHTALVADQYQTNSSNVYKFFDLQPGTISVKISDGNTGALVFDGTITLQQNERLVAEMNASGGMNTVTTMTVTYANWYTENGAGSSTSYNQNTPPPPPPPPAPANTGISPEKFKEIKKTIDDLMADNYKVEKAKSIVKKNAMTSKQIAEICKLMDFDNYKLDFAKFAYDYCVDKSNYYEISSVFSFSSYSEELDKYVDGKN